jgi:hypothetical protein
MNYILMTCRYKISGNCMQSESNYLFRIRFLMNNMLEECISMTFRIIGSLALSYMLSGCASNNVTKKLTYQNIRSSDFHYEMSFEDALEINNGVGFISPDYWPNDGSIYFDKRSVASHQVGVVNQHTRYLNGNDMSEVSTELFNSMEYWLIRETKRKLIGRFLKNSGKSTNQHKLQTTFIRR